MTKREVIKMVLDHKKPPYVPWNFEFTFEANEKIMKYYDCNDLIKITNNHFLQLGGSIGFFTEIEKDRFQDYFGVVWDRSIDKDIGNPLGQVLPEPTISNYSFPDPLSDVYFDDIPNLIEKYPENFRVFNIGFSLFERAWSMRGMEDLMMDFMINPNFVHELMNAICEYNIKQINKACTFDIDAVKLGDDWGQQKGLIMGQPMWKEFIAPYLAKMYKAIKDNGKYVFIHSCGDVDELFDSLIDMGLDCFNPFQPEVMDVYTLLPEYRDRLSFHGGLSTQQILPYGSVNDVRNASKKLLQLGSEGGYVFSPSHDVEGDVPIENIVAFIEEANNQITYVESEK